MYNIFYNNFYKNNKNLETKITIKMVKIKNYFDFFKMLIKRQLTIAI